jgi:uncharacterized membrane protein YcaP (DUF421 family)
VTLVLALLPVSPGRVAEQAAKAAIVVLVLLVGLRLTGKREVGQFQVYDLVMLIALSNAVQNAMTGGLGNLPIGLATSSTIVVTAWGLSRLLARRPRLEARVLGTPVLLVNQGRVLEARLRQEHISDADLDEACREHGVGGPEACQLVVLEVDGSLSVVPRTAATRERTPDDPGAGPRRRRRDRRRRD